MDEPTCDDLEVGGSIVPSFFCRCLGTFSAQAQQLFRLPVASDLWVERKGVSFRSEKPYRDRTYSEIVIGPTWKTDFKPVVNVQNFECWKIVNVSRQ